MTAYARTRESATAPHAHTREPRPLPPRDAGIHYGRERGCFVDRYNRTADECRAGHELAKRHAEALDAIWQSLQAGEVVLGREAGPRLLDRVYVSWESCAAIATRDLGWAVALEEQASWDARDAALARARDGDAA